MDSWQGNTVAVLTPESEEPIQGELVSKDALGIVLSITTKSKAAAPFVGLFEETEIELMIPWLKVRRMAQCTCEYRCR